MRRQGAELTLPANPAGGDIAEFLRVKLSAGVIAVCAAADTDCVGTLIRRYKSSGLGKSAVAAVLAKNASGTRMCIANGAITAGAAIFAGAGGKVAPSGTVAAGIALTATTADGDEVEVLL